MPEGRLALPIHVFYTAWTVLSSMAHRIGWSLRHGFARRWWRKASERSQSAPRRKTVFSLWKCPVLRGFIYCIPFQRKPCVSYAPGALTTISRAGRGWRPSEETRFRRKIDWRHHLLGESDFASFAFGSNVHAARQQL